MAAGEEFTWLASDVNGNSLDVDVSYINGTTGVYSLNQITFVGDLVVTSSAPADVPGCTNAAATNFNQDATSDDGSCLIEGCTDVNALNFNADANVDDG